MGDGNHIFTDTGRMWQGAQQNSQLGETYGAWSTHLLASNNLLFTTEITFKLMKVDENFLEDENLSVPAEIRIHFITEGMHCVGAMQR